MKKGKNVPTYASYEEAMNAVYNGIYSENDMTMASEALIFADNYGEDDDDEEEEDEE